MKTRLIFFSFILFFFSMEAVQAQSSLFGGYLVPLKPESPLFGTDVTIQNSPFQNQRNIVIGSAFNGWLYGFYSVWTNSLQQDSVFYLRSKDNGVSWSVIAKYNWGIIHVGITRIKIIACGNDTINLKVFIGYCTYDSVTANSTISVVRYNKDLIAEDQILQVTSQHPRDFSLVSDWKNPATNSNPYSLGLVFSKRSISNDSIVFYSSSNGGISFDSHYNIASSQNYLYKVSLSYGRSPSENSGRYFAVWEEFANLNSKSGHIYTAHSEPDFNSPFTSPIVLDNLDPGSTNEASNPVIECQNNSDDNDSLNISEIILYEKYLPLSHKANIAGFYNKKAATSNNFQKFTINALSDNNLQPEICFNLFDSTFNITYFDSTTLNLPYYKHDFNMSDPDSWIELSAGYNDNNNLMAPYPKVVLDFETQLCANVWIGELGNGNGSALFDSPFTYYTGNTGNAGINNTLELKAYPNPASDYVNLEFELQKAERVDIQLINSLGQSLDNVSCSSLSPGNHIIKVDSKKCVSGMVLFTIRAGDSFSSIKVLIR